MNILIYVPQMAAYGGMERHVCTLALEAAHRGHCIRFLTTSNSLNAGTRASLVDAGIDFRELPRPRDSASPFEKYRWVARETLAARFTRLPDGQHWDIIYTNGQSGLASLIWRAAASDSTRIIHHHHTAADEAEQQTWSAGFRRVLARAPEIVACSRATKDHIATATSRSDIRFLPYFTACPLEKSQIPISKFQTDTESSVSFQPSAFSLQPSTPQPSGFPPQHFGFIGRLVGTKGIDTLCALSNRPELAHITWHIHGSGADYPESYFAAYPRIRYHGPYRDLAHYGQILQRLDAVALYTQHNEGMPLSLLEAMSAGLPWVATDRGGTRELAQKSPANTVLIAPEPAAEFSEAALKATLELSHRIQNGTTSRRTQRNIYDTYFSPEVVAHEWFEFLEKKPAAGQGNTATVSPFATSAIPSS